MSALAAPAEEPACLGVERSLTGKRWRQRGGADLVGLAIAQRLAIPEIVGRIMAARGVPLDGVDRHLSPTLRDWLPNPGSLRDMDRAAARLADAIARRETVAVFGDYDVDGATASALLRRFLAALGVPVLIYIPDRRIEGYGPNAPALKRLKEQGASLVVTVDCGTLAHEALGEAAAAGIEVIVLDHHAAEPALPPAVAVVNPNRLDDDSGMGALCAVGVTFLTLVALARALRERGHAGEIPDLLQFLDLVALGTVCDVVPLTGLNRAFVAQGLKIMAQRRRAGLVALADGASVSERLDAYHLGYVLGPRVNAGGRVGRSDLGARLLATDDPEEARRLAAELERLNDERRAIEAQVLQQTIAQVEAAGAGAVVVAHDEAWHQGVLGIVAGRLKERFNRAACVVSWDGGIGRGSGRSVAGIDLGAAIIAARQAGLLMAGGGHPMAAGFTVARDRLAAFAAFLEARIGGQMTGRRLVPELGLDGVLQCGACTTDLCRTLAALGPFGTGNAEPRFALPLVRVAKADVVGNGHVRCFVTPLGGGGRLKAIAFRALETPLGPALLQAGGAALHLAGHLRADTWQGRDDVQLMIDDGAPAQG
ncbi:MAG TPA: single-stranded-DNA-specific exonuclease RecJ [Stellaceae bacterium]|nr:single-stranded-DNA-specific exonuclease RecJ [Stellaceae bacterium]